MLRRYLKFAAQVVLAVGFSSAFAGAYEDFFKSTVNDDARTVEQLLARGFDINSRDEKGQNLLYLSQRDGAPKVAQVLIAHPDLRVDLPNNAGETPLMMAALRDQDSWVAKLLDKGARIDGTAEPGKPGWTPLHYAAASPGAKALQVLMARGARVDARSPNGTTPLMMAAQYGTEEAVELLLKQGADLQARNDLDLVAADFARRGGREALARRLGGGGR